MGGIVYESLKHTKCECKYHVVFIAKYRKKWLYPELRKQLGNVFRDLARQQECQIEEGHLMPDPEHMLIAIPPKYAVAQVMGFLKGKIMCNGPLWIRVTRASERPTMPSTTGLHWKSSN